MDARKDLLLKSAARLYSLGVDLEMAREKLRKLVEQGVPYESREMKDAYKEFSELDAQWKEQHFQSKMKPQFSKLESGKKRRNVLKSQQFQDVSLVRVARLELTAS